MRKCALCHMRTTKVLAILSENRLSWLGIVVNFLFIGYVKPLEGAKFKLFSHFLKKKNIHLHLPLNPIRYPQFYRKIKTKWRSFGGAKQMCLHAVSWIHD